MPSFFRSLFGQVVVALVPGVILGVAIPDFATALKPLGDGFTRLVPDPSRDAREDRDG